MIDLKHLKIERRENKNIYSYNLIFLQNFLEVTKKIRMINTSTGKNLIKSGLTE